MILTLRISYYLIEYSHIYTFQLLNNIRYKIHKHHVVISDEVLKFLVYSA